MDFENQTFLTHEPLSHIHFPQKTQKRLEYARASYKTRLPFATVSSITITPTFDRTKSNTNTLTPTCILEGESGTGRTTAKLDLNWDDSTLTVIHAIDSYHTIAPEISLQTAKIRYYWDVALSSGGSIRTRVDPTSAIHVSWMDGSKDGGKWITDMNLPLGGSGGSGGTTGNGRGGIFAADIRVRRQFRF